MTTVTTDVSIPQAGHHPDPNESYLKTTHSLAGTERGVLSWLTTLDHKRIGIMYLLLTTTAFMIGGIFALLVRIELLTPGKTIVDAETYSRLFTLHGVVMVFLFIIPSI